jgi:hypothetical protein
MMAPFGSGDRPGYPMWLEAAEWLGLERANIYPLHLLSSQPGSQLYCQLDCGEVSPSTMVAHRKPVWLDNDDVAVRGIAKGDVVQIYDNGPVVADVIRPGIIQVATGAWFDPLALAEIGSFDKHGSPSVLTLTRAHRTWRNARSLRPSWSRSTASTASPGDYRLRATAGRPAMTASLESIWRADEVWLKHGRAISPICIGERLLPKPIIAIRGWLARPDLRNPDISAVEGRHCAIIKPEPSTVAGRALVITLLDW